ncbi:MAG: CYTH and CHAD domain-containing protein [Actinomycetota bacterium]|nr:CYTH and CHAD domain-containing protein [Actinomycetota bacterium]
MVTSGFTEIERKYDVGEAGCLPTLSGVKDVAAVGQLVELELEAVYFDTPDLDLARHGVTLRRRTGGQDGGWHLKFPEGSDTRTEVRLPLGRAVKTVPTRLLPAVRALIRDRPLAPVATVTTRRLEYSLTGDDGIVLAQICDDTVHAERLHGSFEARDWREWEVELVAGPRSLLNDVERHLIDAGAFPAKATSKLVRALGDAAPPVTTKPTRKTLARGSAADLLIAHVAHHTSRLHHDDAGVRTERDGSVHQLRIAARHLRAALSSYQPLFTPNAADPLREELRWLGQTLSEARDAQVLRKRLGLLLAGEPAELVLGPVKHRVDAELDAAYRTGRQKSLEALDSDRYYRLLDALDVFVTSAPLTREADQPARKIVSKLLKRDAKRLRRAVRQSKRARHGEESDLALHEVRKRAKRLRYAAELATPVLGAPARALAAGAERVQETLGEHQDAVIAREKLRQYGDQAHLDGENEFTFGRLHALEQGRADQAERDFTRAWAKLRRRRLRASLCD